MPCVYMVTNENFSIDTLLWDKWPGLDIKCGGRKNKHYGNPKQIQAHSNCPLSHACVCVRRIEFLFRIKTYENVTMYVCCALGRVPIYVLRNISIQMMQLPVKWPTLYWTNPPHLRVEPCCLLLLLSYIQYCLLLLLLLLLLLPLFTADAVVAITTATVSACYTASLTADAARFSFWICYCYCLSRCGPLYCCTSLRQGVLFTVFKKNEKEKSEW